MYVDFETKDVEAACRIVMTFEEVLFRESFILGNGLTDFSLSQNRISKKSFLLRIKNRPVGCHELSRNPNVAKVSCQIQESLPSPTLSFSLPYYSVSFIGKNIINLF